MAYQFDFGSVLAYTDVLAKGVAVTAQLTVTGGVLGVAVAILGAWARTEGPRWLRGWSAPMWSSSAIRRS